jgi:hypothetical protein
MSPKRKAAGGKLGSGAKRTATPMEEVPLRLRGVLLAYPVRNEPGLSWKADAGGLVTITHPKNLRKWERWLMGKVGGSPIINRKLDAPASEIWMLCDGKHTVADICSVMDKKYKEDMEPVLTRVVKFLEMLLERNLISLQRAPVLRERGRLRPKKTAAKGGEGA